MLVLLAQCLLILRSFFSEKRTKNLVAVKTHLRILSCCYILGHFTFVFILPYFSACGRKNKMVRVFKQFPATGFQ